MMIGASPVGTGLPGKYDHFLTPLGVFHHSPDNMDFRAEGTTNENGIRGYGHRDMRIYDFGWVDGERGGARAACRRCASRCMRPIPIASKRCWASGTRGCVRIPASLNTFFDQHGLLDDDYQARVEAGKSLGAAARSRHHADRGPLPGRDRQRTQDAAGMVAVAGAQGVVEAAEGRRHGGLTAGEAGTGAMRMRINPFY